MHLLQGSKQQMVVAGGHCRGKSKGKTERKRLARGCQGTSVWPKEQNTGVSISGKTVGLLEGRVRGYPIAKMPLDKNLCFVQDPE